MLAAKLDFSPVGCMPARQATKPVGALVLGGDYQGLGIVRSLGRRGIPVCVIDDEISISRFSRYTTRAIAVSSLRDEKQIAETILDVGRRLDLEGWIVYPTRDEMVAALSRYRSSLAGFFRIPTPNWDTIKWAWDKRNTYHLANELGIATPATWYPCVAEDLKEITIDPPFTIKPAIKEHFIYATKAKAWRANSHAELRELFRRAAAQVGPQEVMIQDLIPGDGRQQFAYCAFFKDGQAIGSMVVRRSRQHPPEFGRSSTFVETVELPLLEALSQRFLRAINYYGLVELEYKLDPRDGQFRLLDVNARTWGYHSLGRSAGVDFSYLLFADQVGEAVQPCRGRPGVSWVRLLTDAPTAVSEMLRGRQDLWAYLRSLKHSDTESVFSPEDPLPAVMEVGLVPYLSAKRGF